MKHEEQKELLEKYVKHKLCLTPTVNITQFDIYDGVGKYFYEKLDNNTYEELSGYGGIIKPIKEKKLFGNREEYSQIAIFFLTSFLNEKSLKEMFGKPIKHSHFGEGFEPERKYTYTSHMVKLNDFLFHIGHDHRGTSIEVQIEAKKEDVKNCFHTLIDLYFEKVLIK